MGDYREYFDRLLGSLGYTSSVLVTGCEDECSSPEAWPYSRAIVYAYLVIAIYALARLTGRVPAITSAFRCEPCNSRRGGAERSRHLAQTSGGEPYGAVDIQWPAGYLDQVIAYLGDVPDWIRAVTGLDVGVGVIAYPGRRRLHLDLRETDYVSDRT